jgi:hypothetical protein
VRGVELAGEFAIGILAAAAALWAVGFFGTTSYGTYGYGDYKLNLLWPIISYGWSRLFPDLPHTRLDYEGLSFLGIGILALLLLTIISGAIIRLRHALSRYWLPLTAMLIALMVFAFSKDLAILNQELVSIPIPGFIDAVGAAFRSTGRFVWPLLYMVTIGAVVLVAGRFRAAVALPLIAVALVTQVWDSAPKWQAFEDHMPPPSATWSTELDSPLWQRAAKAGYNRIRSIPVDEGYGSDWKALGYFALTHGMEIDTVYLGRVDSEDRETLEAYEDHVLRTGQFEPRTIYVLNVRSSLLAARHTGPDDLITVADGRIVLLPGGHALGEGLERWSGD